jgi:cobalamin-dependent methionine synthase I
MVSEVQEIHITVLNGRYGQIKMLIDKALQKNIKPEQIIEDTIETAMADVLDRFGSGKLHYPDLLLSLKTMNTGLDHLDKFRSIKDVEDRYAFLVKTGKTGFNDIGENLVTTILKCYRFRVMELGALGTFNLTTSGIKEFKPRALILSGEPYRLFHENYKLVSDLDNPCLQEYGYYVAFSPPVTDVAGERVIIQVFADLPDKDIRRLLKVFNRTFHRIEFKR